MSTLTINVKIWMALSRRAGVAAGSLSPAIPVYGPEVVEPAGECISIKNIIGEPERLDISGRIHRREGVFQLIYQRPVAKMSYENALETAGKIASHFTPIESLSFSGVCIEIDSEPTVHEGFRERGLWLTPIRVHWSTVN